MEGKIHPESTSLAQDKARILFDYYRKAAEKIVAEELELEKRMAVCAEERAAAAAEFKKNRKKGFIAAGAGVLFLLIAIAAHSGVLAILGLGAAAAGGVLFGLDLNKRKKAFAEKDARIEAFKGAHKDIRRAYSVSKLGVAYVPIASQIPFEDKSFFIDHTGSVPESRFDLASLRAPAELGSAVEAVRGLSAEVPLVESAEETETVSTAEYSTSIQNVQMYKYLGELDRQIRNVSFQLRNVDNISVSLPVVMPGSEEAAFIRDFAASDPSGGPVVPVFRTDAHDGMLESFNSLNAMKQGASGKADGAGGFFGQLMRDIAVDTQVLVQAKLRSSASLLEQSNRTFSEVLKASFNHYSPTLEAEEIERIKLSTFDYKDEVNSYRPFVLKPSSRVRYDPFSGNWVAEDGSRTSIPFGLHQIQEEVLAPVIQNLMEETRIERLKIYNRIKDQKMDYLNKCHQETMDFYGRNRAESNDLINRMRDTLSEYMASYNTFKALQKTEAQMGADGDLASAQVDAESSSAEALAAFETQANAFRAQQDDFVAFMDRLKDDIDRKAVEFGHIEYYEASLRDDESRKTARSIDGLQALDPRRRSLAAAGPHFAAYAVLPPEPRVESKMYEDFSIDLVEESRRVVSSGSVPEKTGDSASAE